MYKYSMKVYKYSMRIPLQHVQAKAKLCIMLEYMYRVYLSPAGYSKVLWIVNISGT